MPERAPGSAHVRCDSCAAACCRLTVVLDAADCVPAGMTEQSGQSTIMARGADGWCVALDRTDMRCSIYASRPSACRRFAMNGPYCRAVRVP